MAFKEARARSAGPTSIPRRESLSTCSLRETQGLVYSTN